MRAAFAVLPTLAAFAAWDLEKKRLPRCWLLLYAVCGLPAAFLRCGMGPPVWLADMVPGLFVLFLGRLTAQSIGYGDGWTVLACGLWAGGAAAAGTLFLGLVLAGLFGAGLLLMRRGSGKTKLPFIPFLAAGEALRLLLQSLRA